MAHNQGGLNSIDSISGVQPPTTSAVEKVPQIGDYNYTRTQQTSNQKQFLGLTAQHITTPFNSRALDATFFDKNNVGMNPFGNPDIQRDKALAEGKGFNLYGLA